MGIKTVRHYGPVLTPLSRVLECAEVCKEKKEKLAAEKKALNPFWLRREVGSATAPNRGRTADAGTLTGRNPSD